MNLLFKYIVLVFLFLFSQNFVFASHVAGGSIKYKSIGGNRYYVEVSVLRDCNGIQYSATTPTVSAKCSSASTFSTYSLNFKAFVAPTPNPFGGPYSSIKFTSGTTNFAVEEVSDVCNNVLNPNKSSNSRCRSTSSTIGGFTRFTYSGIVTFSKCNYFLLGLLPQCCRSSANANIAAGNGSNWLEAKIDSKNFPNNSSPVFGNERQPAFNACVGQEGEYHFGSNDADGDSLTYKLVCPKLNATSCVTYNSGYSATRPVIGAKLDFNTGRFLYKPSSVGKKYIGVLIDEYDACSKKWKGSTLREVIMFASVCTRKYPKYTHGIYKVSGNASKVDSFRVKVISGSSISIEDTIYGVSSKDTVVLISDYAQTLPGSKLKITQIAKNKLHYKFTWNTPVNARGIKYFHLTLSDDVCSFPAKRRIAIALDFTPKLTIAKMGTSRSDTLLLMKGDSLSLTTGGRGTVSWKTISGDSIQWSGTKKNIWGDTTISDTNASILFRPLQNSIIIANGSLKNACQGKSEPDTIYIKVIPTFQIKVSDTLVCSNIDSIQLLVVPDSNYSYTYSWVANGGTISNPKISNPFVTRNLQGEYAVTVISQFGGERTAKIKVRIANEIPRIQIISNADSVCLGGEVKMAAEFVNKGNACELLPRKSSVNSILSHDTLTLLSSNSGVTIYPNPFANNHPSSKQMYLYKASDLASNGMKKGTFQSISFYVDTALSNSAIKTFKGYNIKVGCVNQTYLSSWINSSLKEVVSNKTVSVSLGWNVIEFDSAYVWDGKSNLAIQICYDNGGVAQGLSLTSMQTVPYNASLCYYGTSACASQSLSMNSRNRIPVIKFGYANELDSTSLNYTWFPNSTLSGTNKNRTNAKPNVTTTYSLAIVDTFGICRDTIQKTIQVVKAIVNAGKDTSLCDGKTITFYPTVSPNNGGNYSWLPASYYVNNRIKNATHKLNGSKALWVNYSDSFGCNVSDTIKINQIPLPPPGFTTKTKYCESESVWLLNPVTSGGRFSGLGVTGSNFNASDPKVKPGLNSLKSVAIKYSVTKQGCSSDTTIVVLVYPVFDTVYSGNRVFCSIDPIENLMTRHSGGTWSGKGVVGRTFNPVAAGIGSHTIKVDSTGFCGNKANYLFEVLKSPDHDFPDTVYGCDKKPLLLDAGNPGANYLWNTGAIAQKITATSSGKYWVKISVGSMCETIDTTQVKITAICLGVSALHSAKSKIKIYPNPTSQFLNLESGEEKIEWVTLLDLNGKVIQEFDLNSENTVLDLGDVVAGIYFIRVKRNSATENYRIIIN